MSDLSGERSQKSHGGSSLSIFSAVGTSSPSGTSDIGHVNAEELTDNSLAVLVEDASKAVRRLELETQMFTGVHSVPLVFPTQTKKSMNFFTFIL